MIPDVITLEVKDLFYAVLNVLQVKIWRIEIPTQLSFNILSVIMFYFTITSFEIRFGVSIMCMGT